MRTSSVRAFYRLAILLVFALASLAQPVVRAQDPTPPPPQVLPSNDGTSNVYDAQVVTPETVDTGEPKPEAEPAQEQVTDADEQKVSTDASATAFAFPVATTTDQEQETPSVGVFGIQGVVTLDVAVAETVAAGGTLDYTYIYRNTGNTTVSGIVVETLWSNFSTTVDGNWQFCEGTCDVVAGSVVGPTVTRDTTTSGSGTRFNIGNLGAGQTGQFKVRVRVSSYTYPKSNYPVTRPAGSARLYMNSNLNAVVSEDTVSSLVIGPVLTLSKTALSTDKIYPGETGTFTIRVGNATGTADKPNGQMRADARNATNMVIKDWYPAFSEFVSATGNYTIDNTSKTMTWTLPGPLAPGEYTEVQVTFRKLDNNQECISLNNGLLNVTSNEMPIIGGARVVVQGSGASMPVQVPFVFKSYIANPAATVYGAETTITIVVQNYWSQPLVGAKLQYDLQSNGFYVAGSANPVPSTIPDSNQPGGRLVWTFNMAAGSKTAPTETTLSFRLRADYTSYPQAGTGYLQLIAPTGVPTLCNLPIPAVASFIPRLTVTKATDVDQSTMSGNLYIVQRNQEFPYYIDIKNQGPTDALGVTVRDLLPRETGANFSYVVGSATLNDTSRPPDSFTNGSSGTIIWNNLNIPANSTIRLRYRLKVDGRDYQPYCNSASATKGTEPISFGAVNVCVKINPQISVTKTVDKTNANPGDEVRFTLRVKNNEATTYRVGLYDILGYFTFVRQESGYDQPQIDPRFANSFVWPARDLGAGQELTAVFVAKVPTTCTTTTYGNLGLFHNDLDIIQPIPPVIASVNVACVPQSAVQYTKVVDRTLISLRDQVGYLLQVYNPSPTPVSNIVIEDLLPVGFTYVGLQGTSGITTEPTQGIGPNSRPKLTWNIPTIAAGGYAQVRYFARSGDVVGSFENWLKVPTGATCVGACKSVDGVNYSYQSVTVQPLITMEPKINTDACAQPGSTRTYRLTIVNTNIHDYTDTDIRLTLPFGLRYRSASPSTPNPSVSVDAAGVTTVAWDNLRVPAPSGGSIGTQMVFEIDLGVGQVWGDLGTVVTTTSPDGLIPRKDGVANPTVPVCPANPSIAKDASRSSAKVGDEILYQISLGNPTSSSMNVTVQDVLPTNLTFVSTVQGQPTVNGNTLTWSGVSVPARSIDGKPGVLNLQFKARLTSCAVGSKTVNTAQVTSSPTTFSTTFNSIAVGCLTSVYLPAIRK